MDFTFDIQLLIQTVLYLVTVIVGIVIAATTGVTQKNFNGQCILYGRVDWLNVTSVDFHPGSTSTCDFVVAFSSVTCILYPAIVCGYYGYGMMKSLRTANVGSEMLVTPFLLINGVLSCCLLIEACIISVGFNSWCQSLIEGIRHGSTVSRCSDVEKASLDWDDPKINPTSFFSDLTAAQTASWVCFLFWVAQLVLTVIRLVFNRRIQRLNDYEDPNLIRSRPPAEPAPV